MEKNYKKEMIERAVNRFLAWRLPRDFAPDCGITYIPNSHPNLNPTGTNLLTADQARAMFEHCLAEQEEKENPTAPASLVELSLELLEMAENPDTVISKATEDSEAVYKSECFDFEKARRTILRYQPAESLAELAYRKGFEGIQIYAPHNNTGWAINMIVNGVERTISAYEMTYSEAESKAREYLNGLPDKGSK